MAKTEWGLKRTCLSCGARFYDLSNKPIICPKCETTFDPEAAVKLRRNRGVPVEVKKPKPKDDILDTKVDDLEDNAESTEDEDVLDDTSDLNAGEGVGVAVPADENNDDS